MELHSTKGMHLSNGTRLRCINLHFLMVLTLTQRLCDSSSENMKKVFNQKGSINQSKTIRK